jgi:hypothetical protein
MVKGKVAVMSGCGDGSGGPGGGNSNQNGGGGNDNQNDNGGGGNDNGDSPEPPDFTVRILPDPALTTAEVGEVIMLSIIVRGDLEEPSYAWSISPQGRATLSDPDAATTDLTPTASGTLIIELRVTDGADGERATDTLMLTITDPVEPPADARIEIVPVPPAEVGDFIALIAQLEGPDPIRMDWTPDPDNIVDAGQLLFTDLGNGQATFTVPDLFTFPYELVFTFTATYSNGGVLSKDVVVVVN